MACQVFWAAAGSLARCGLGGGQLSLDGRQVLRGDLRPIDCPAGRLPPGRAGSTRCRRPLVVAVQIEQRLEAGQRRVGIGNLVEQRLAIRPFDRRPRDRGSIQPPILLFQLALGCAALWHLRVARRPSAARGSSGKRSKKFCSTGSAVSSDLGSAGSIVFSISAYSGRPTAA